MYNIFTSYFSNPKLKNADGIKIAVCNSLVSSLSRQVNYHWKEVAPDSHDLIYPFEQLIWYYTGKLRLMYKNRQLSKYINFLCTYKNYCDVFLLCYEKPCLPCHRDILADFINKEYSSILEIKEY